MQIHSRFPVSSCGLVVSISLTLGYRSTTDREPYFPICGAPLQRPVQGNYAVGKQVVKPLMPSGATFRTVYHNSHTFHNSISLYISILVLCLCFCARWARTWIDCNLHITDCSKTKKNNSFFSQLKNEHFDIKYPN